EQGDRTVNAPQLRYHSVRPFPDLVRRFAAGTAVAIQIPVRLLRADFLERQPLVLAAVPLTQIRFDAADVDEPGERARVAGAAQRAAPHLREADAERRETA